MAKNSKKHWLGALAAAFLGAVFLWNPHQEIVAIPAAGAVNLTGDVSDVIFTVSTYALELGKFIAWVCFAFLTYLLDPRFIFDLGGGDDFLEILRSIWQLSRDLMNVIFAIMLVFAALYVIVMNKKDFIQEHIAKFVIAVVFVNFSWFFPRVILDISSVLTSTIYGIPSLLNSQCVTDDDEQCVAATSILFLPSDEKKNELDASDGWDCSRMGGFICVQLKPLDANTVSQSSTVLNGLIINHARLVKLGEIPPPDLSGDDFTGKALFAMRQGIILIIVIAMVFPLIAMCVAFFLRIPMLWLTVAFMPFYFLDLVGGEKISQGYGKKIWENFLSAAFLPALVAIPLTVGFILLNAGDQIAFQSLDNVPFRLLDGIGTLHELMWLFLALAVMWTGVFGVLKKQEIIGKGADRIEGFGKELGKLAVNTPLSIPLVPGITGGGPTIAGLLNSARPSLLNAQLRQGRPLREVISSIPAGGRTGGTTNTALAGQANRAVTAITNNATIQLRFNNNVRTLETATTAAQVETAATHLIDELRREGVTNVTRGNLVEVLEEMRRNRASIGKLEITERALSNLRTPPTAPAPAPAPAPPPPPPAP